MIYPKMPQVAGRGLVVRDEKVLLVRGDGDGTFWTLPGGRSDLGEDIRTCVRREVYEETGLSVAVGSVFSVSEYYDETLGWHVLQVIFRCVIETGTLQDGWVDHGGTVQKAEFFTVEELRQLDTVFPSYLRDGWEKDRAEVYCGIERKS